MSNDARPIRPARQGVEIGCKILAPEPYRRQARYALETLLRPLGVELRDELERGIWYGGEAPDTGDWLYIPLDPETPGRVTSSVAAEQVRWVDHRGESWPLLFAGGIGGEGDPVGSAFYWLAGCDELANPSRDRHGRPLADDSLLARLNMAQRAPVDAYREMLAAALSGKGFDGFPRSWNRASWAFCPTFDIDYLRKWRPGILYRETVEYLVQGRGPGPRVSRFLRSIRQFLGSQDAYRLALTRIVDELTRCEARGTFFFKAGAHGPHDVPYSLDGRFARRTLSALQARGHEIGLHGSYHAYNHPGYLQTEHGLLAAATESPVSAARSHYLRFDANSTPRALRAVGIQVDSTLAFSDRSGFRNGTCLPFEVWDHGAGRGAGVIEMPLAFMDSTLFNRLKLDSEEAVQDCLQLANTVQRFGGVLVGLWHNVLWDEPDFEGWGEHFIRVMEEVGQGGALVTSLRGALESWD